MRISTMALGVSLAFAATPALADDLDGAEDRAPIVVTGQHDALDLDKTTRTGSRLDLSIRETPASVETLTRADIEFRGLRTAREAFADVPGAIAGNVPGNPAVVTMRGFAGNVVSILQDGVRISTSTVVQRDTGTWHFDRIEVIKGPASVLFGEGALAGVINKVTRKPTFDGNHMDNLMSFGSFDTITAAGGVNYQLSDTVAVRADASYLHSDSLYDVDSNQTRSTGLTASVLFRPSADLSVLVAVDHYNDNYDSAYQGIALIPRRYARDPSDTVGGSAGLVADRALQHENYTPRGGFSGADETTVRSRIDWKLGGGWSIAADLIWYTADRAFVNNGTRIFVAPTPAFPNGSFQRGLTRFYHDHKFWNARLAIANDSVIAGLRNRFTLGAEYNHTHFSSLRETSTNTLVPAVDPFDPAVGSFSTDDTAYRSSNVNFDSMVDAVSVFAEDAINLTPEWLLVGGARFDHIDLERITTDYLTRPNAVTSANPIYNPFSWRVGISYAVTKGLTVYGQYTTAVSLVSSILLQSIANTAFRLTKGRSYEAGAKLDAFDQRLSLTAAAYRIVQNDILTRDPANPLLTVQGGRQSSQGVEVSAELAATRHLSVGGSFSYTDAQYDRLVEAGGLNRSGNRPVNVPSTTAAAHASYALPDLPLTVSGFARHVSGFYTDTANTIFVKGRTTLDAALAWQVMDNTTLTLRGRNLTNRFYGEYSGYAATDVYIGAPRSFEVSLGTHF